MYTHHEVCASMMLIISLQIKELENTKPFSTEKEILNLIKSCLQVSGDARPTASNAVKVFKQHLLAD